VFEFARRDRAIADNPAAGIENAPVQRRPPDPFTLEEVDAILEDLTDREPEQVPNYFAAAFFAGFRPSEQIALVWSDMDFLRQEVRVQRAIVRGQAKPNTKTYLVRDVELNERAWEAFEAQRPHTQLAGGAIFKNPETDEAWADEKRQHVYWGRCLRRLGLRYREPYQARHSFATLNLMAGANPSWVARQLGHVNPQMLFKVYAKWIDGADKSRERDKVNAVLGHKRATEIRENLETAARSIPSLAEREGFEPVSVYRL
jgi:integrase